MIETTLTLPGRLGFLTGKHHEDDVYMIALYTEDADLGCLTKAYTPKGEVRGPGYQAGGKILTQYHAGVDEEEDFAYLSWLGPIRWENATIKAAGALIYNASKQNLSVATCGFGGVISSTNGPWYFPTPPAGPEGAMVRLDR